MPASASNLCKSVINTTPSPINLVHLRLGAMPAIINSRTKTYHSPPDSTAIRKVIGGLPNVSSPSPLLPNPDFPYANLRVPGGIKNKLLPWTRRPCKQVNNHTEPAVYYGCWQNISKTLYICWGNTKRSWVTRRGEIQTKYETRTKDGGKINLFE